MKSNRRNFIRSAAVTGGIAAAFPFTSSSPKAQETKQGSIADYSKLGEVLKMPVLKRELFPDPVIIETLELLRDRNNMIYRVRSKDGAVGISVSHPFIALSGYPIFRWNDSHHESCPNGRNSRIKNYTTHEPRRIGIYIPDAHGFSLSGCRKIPRV